MAEVNAYEVVLNRKGKMVQGHPEGLRSVLARMDEMEQKMDSIYLAIEEVRKILPSPVVE
jgi:hypothetical protein